MVAMALAVTTMLFLDTVSKAVSADRDLFPGGQLRNESTFLVNVAKEAMHGKDMSTATNTSGHTSHLNHVLADVSPNNSHGTGFSDSSDSSETQSVFEFRKTHTQAWNVSDVLDGQLQTDDSLDDKPSQELTATTTTTTTPTHTTLPNSTSTTPTTSPNFTNTTPTETTTTSTNSTSTTPTQAMTTSSNSTTTIPTQTTTTSSNFTSTTPTQAMTTSSNSTTTIPTQTTTTSTNSTNKTPKQVMTTSSNSTSTTPTQTMTSSPNSTTTTPTTSPNSTSTTPTQARTTSPNSTSTTPTQVMTTSSNTTTTTPTQTTTSSPNSTSTTPTQAKTASAFPTNVTPSSVTQKPVCDTFPSEHMRCLVDTLWLTVESNLSLTVGIKPSTRQEKYVLCQWAANPPPGMHVNVTITPGTNFTGNFTLEVYEDRESYSSWGDSLFVGSSQENLKITNLFPDPIVIDNATLSETGSFYLHASFYQLYFLLDVTIGTSDDEEVLNLCFEMGRGIPVLRLPLVRLSKTTGYVTSPGYDVTYSDPYDGFADLDVADNESMMITFHEIDVKNSDGKCADNYVQLSVAGESTVRRVCQVDDVQAEILQSSLRVSFHKESFEDDIFKMAFAVFPRIQLLPGDLWNCSVPHFHSFQSLLRCNLLLECAGGEDERNCSYYSQECGYNSIDAGSKCYTLVRPSHQLSWDEASRNCSRQGQQLATFDTRKDFIHFKVNMKFGKEGEDFCVGALRDSRLESVSTNALYKNVWQWVDKRSIFTFSVGRSDGMHVCAFYRTGKQSLLHRSCDQKVKSSFVCEFRKKDKNPSEAGTPSRLLQKQKDVVWDVSVVQCPPGHVSRDFLSCDSKSECGASDKTSCIVGNVTMPMFLCGSRSTVHYTLLCDHIQHCPDNTDEDFCYHPDCLQHEAQCRNRQCVQRRGLCDERLDCYDGSDENCFQKFRPVESIATRLAVYVNETGEVVTRHLNDSDPCPETHFPCQDNNCLPVFFLCNGIADCPGREDEAGCDSYTCPGFYRCRGSRVCVHNAHVCDDVPQCPQQDDELLCTLTCPDACRCQGLAFVCSEKFSTRTYPAVRYLDASGTGMTPADVTDSIYLVSLRLSACNIKSLSLNVNLPNLRELDLSFNEVIQVDMQDFQSLMNLRKIVLSGNPLTELTNSDPSGQRSVVVEHIDLSHTSLQVFNGSVLKGFPAVKALNLSWSKVHTITDKGFQFAAELRILDVTVLPLRHFPSNLLRHLTSLSEVYADNFKLCCEAILPSGFPSKNCHATQDLFASCEDLLKSNTYRVFLWFFASFSVAGNAGSIATRLYLHRGTEAMGSFSVFVTSLCLSDLLMGVYLAVVGVADVVYQGEYLWHDDDWKSSGVCSFAGFLSFLSSEVSAFIICLITLDRFLVLRFPFSRVHFGRCSALLACCVVWVVGVALAAVPLLPWTSHWEFYGQTGICIPLPFTSSEGFHGYQYSFSVMILLNFALFLLIVLGQGAIYWSVRSNSLSSSSKSGSSKDSAIARRLATVVVSDFLCWFPIGLLGLLASRGTPIPEEVSVAVAIFVLPLNSSLNPFLYTLNVIAEKRRKAKEARLLKLLQSRVQR